MSGLVETLSWLVNIPSPTGEEASIRDAIADRLADHETHAVADSIVVGAPGADKTLLVGHLDTVPLQSESGSRIEGDRLYGLGSTDMKSGVAVMIHLLEDLGTQDIVGVFYAGEEGPISGNQLEPILDRFPELEQAAAGIVLEPTNLSMEAGCNGAINATLTFVGDPAHSARPWLGINAVSKAGDFLARMHQLEPQSHLVNGLEFKEVMSVTRASGGIANNVIPGRFDMNVNYQLRDFASRRQRGDLVSVTMTEAVAVTITEAGA